MSNQEKIFNELKKEMGIIKRNDELLQKMQHFDDFKKVRNNRFEWVQLQPDSNKQVDLLKQDFTENLINKKSIKRLRSLIENNKKIWIFGDYDSDGFNAAMVLYKLFMAIGFDNFEFIFPTRWKEAFRFSDEPIQSKYIWFGIKDTILDVVESGQWLITIDNGWRQIGTILKLKNKWIKPIVIDHHNLSYDIEEKKAWMKIVEIPKRDEYARVLKETRKAVLVDDDAIYNHPLLKSPYSEYSGSLMAYFFAQTFIKQTKLIDSNNKKDLLQNLLIHWIVGNIGDVQSLIPTKGNRARELYFKAKELVKNQIKQIAKAGNAKEYQIFNSYYEKKLDNNYKNVIKRVFKPYKKEKNKVIYTSWNKEMLYLMKLKGLNSLNIKAAWWMMCPLINHFGRVGYMGELFNKLRYFSEPKKYKLFTLKEEKKAIDSMRLRRESVERVQEIASMQLDVKSSETYKKENNIRVSYLTEFNSRSSIKDYYNGAESLWFLPSFLGLAAWKIQRKFKLNSIVVSGIKRAKDERIRFKWSWRGLGNVNLNGILQKVIKDPQIKKSNIEISWGGHAQALWCEIIVPTNKIKECFNTINKVFIKYCNKEETRPFIKKQLKDVWMIYEGDDLKTFLINIHKDYISQFKEIGTNKFKFPSFKVNVNKIIVLLKNLSSFWYNVYKLWDNTKIKIDKFMKKKKKKIIKSWRKQEIDELVIIDVDSKNDLIVKWK